VVHAHGPLTVYEDPDRLEQHLRNLTSAHEAAFADPWSIDHAPSGYVRGLLKGIVGIEIPITLLEGKWKVSQNRPATDRSGVVEGLRTIQDTAHQGMAELVSANKPLENS
jgi:transcriptional regulator